MQVILNMVTRNFHLFFRLCEVVDINPIPILMAIVIHANIGGTATPVGDPPNVIITSNSYILNSHVTFLTFTAHMSVGVILVMIATSIYFRLKYKNINKLRMHEPKEIKELRRNIMVWERTAASISPYHKDANLVRETLLKKVKVLQHQLKKKMSKGILPHELYTATLGELQKSVSMHHRTPGRGQKKIFGKLPMGKRCHEEK
jgi:P protein